MAATKSASSGIVNAASSAAASTYASPSTGCQSAWQNLTTSYGSVISGRMTNSSSAPGVGCTVQIDLSPDNGTTVRQFASVTGGIIASTSYDFDIEIPASAMYSRVTFFGNTTNSVTVTAEVQSLTGI